MKFNGGGKFNMIGYRCIVGTDLASTSGHGSFKKDQNVIDLEYFSFS
jgi:hypothetical protein